MSSGYPSSARRPSYSMASYELEKPSTPLSTQSGRPASVSESARRRPRRASEAIVSRAGYTSNNRSFGLSDLVQTQGNAMKVYVRVRPYSERELAQQGMSVHSTLRIDAENPAHLTVLDPNKGFEPTGTFPFTRCFWSVFEQSTNDQQNNRAMTDMRGAVDTYLNGGMNSGHRLRAMSNAAVTAGGYVGSGSAAAMVDENVSHPPYASQAEVYRFVGRPVLDNTVDGYNGCVFAYGQTGSGKTFTMLGYAPAPNEVKKARRMNEREEAVLTAATENANDSLTVMSLNDDDGEDVVNKAWIDPIELQGIIPRICVDLYDALRRKREQNDSLSYRVEVAYYEIYNEKVFDLIKSNKMELKVGNNPISGPYVDGLATKVCVCEADVLRVIRKGMQERHTAATKFNDRSSRSHAILVFNLLQIYLDSAGSTTKLESKLNLVDLAGSERAGAAGVDRPEFKEGVNINLSLTVLGRVIDCLADLSKNKSLSVPVPYRDSRLTMLLMDSIGGNSQTSMIATVSPHMINVEEMKQTIRYAARAKQIINRAVRNEDPQVVYIRELKSEVERLQVLLKEAGGHEFTRDYVLELEHRVRDLERRCEEQQSIIASLRAELESAGISDPTRYGSAASMGMLSGGGAGGAGSQGMESSRSGAAIRQATESLQMQLDTANREIKKLQAELLARAGTVGSSKVEEAQGNKILELQRRIDGFEEDVRDRDNLLRNYGNFHVPWVTELVCSAFESKGLAAIRECRSLMTVRGLALDELMNKGQVSGLVALNEQQRRHDQEVGELVESQRRQAAEMEKLYEQRDADRQRKHREALAAVEARLQGSISTYEQEKRRMAQERDSMRLHFEDLLTRERMRHQEEIKKIGQNLTAGSGDMQRVTDAARTVTDDFEKKLREAHTELEAVRGGSEVEQSKLRAQISADAAKKEAELNEKDRQRREVERQLSALRQDNLKAVSDARRTEKENQTQIKALKQQQDGLVAAASSAVSAWETKAAVDTRMDLLKRLLADNDFSTSAALRLRTKDGAAAAAAAAAALSSSTGAGMRTASSNSNSTNNNHNDAASVNRNSAAGAGASAADIEAKEREFKAMLAQMKKTNEDRNANMQRLQQDCYEQQTRLRGTQGQPSQKDAGTR